jgi:hypothetical protein
MPLGMERASEHDRAASLGQLRLARRLAVEQGEPELRFQIGNRIADDRCRPAEPWRGACDAALIHQGQEGPQLIQRRRTGVGRLIDFLERYGSFHIGFLAVFPPYFF